MESDDIMRFSHKWYEMTREEKIHENFKRVARAFQIYKDKFTNYEISYINWYNLMF